MTIILQCDIIVIIELEKSFSMFEFFRTSFKFVVAFLTPDILLYMGIGMLFIMLVWNALSLIFSFERKFSKTCLKNIRFVKNSTLTPENYPEFINLWASFPSVMRRNWKRYESKRSGIPSDYLKQGECLDQFVSGGITKQNRSLMNTVIYLFVIFASMCSIAIVGTAQALPSTDVVVTTKVLSEALLIPLIIFLVLKGNYYIYTSIRQNQYTTAVDLFNDFVDLLDEKIDVSLIFFGGEQSIAIVSDIYTNDTLEYLRKVEKRNFRKKRNGKFTTVESAEMGRKLKPSSKQVVGSKQTSVKPKNVIKDSGVRTMIRVVSSKYPSGEIKTKKDFERIMGEVEVLLDRVKEETDREKIKSMNDEINGKVALLTAYKNKIKSNREKK